MTKCELILGLLLINGNSKAKIASYVKTYNYDFDKIIQSLKLSYKGKEEQIRSSIIKARNIINLSKNKGINCVCFLDECFPKKLYENSEPAIFLFYKGNLDLLSKSGITIIGTRHPSVNLAKDGEIVSSYYAKKGYVIVSGLALGCDSIAHAAAIKNKGYTIAVLPSDIQNITPKSNMELANNIIKNGGLLISEYCIGTPFNKFNYIKRDRIQSFLTNVVLVIESTNIGGTMFAVNRSIKDNKKVFALQGNCLSVVKNYIDADNLSDLKTVESFIK